MEDNSNEILTLLAKDERAADMFNQPHNRDRYKPPEWRFDRGRESTPSCAGDEEIQNSGSSLKLTFDKTPKRADLGYTFGSDPRKCDVFLPKNGISGVHFRVRFSSEGQLLLEDTSKFGMWLSFNGQRSRHPRHQFTCVLTVDIKTIEADFGDDHSPRFEFKIPRHTNIQAYQENLAIFQRLGRDAGPSLGSLVLSSETATAQPSRAMSPRRRPWYLREDDQEGVLGRGYSGVVYKARDISTNELYAIKEFHAPRAHTAKERAYLTRSWQKEIEIMRTLPGHPHIVRFVDDTCDEGALRLVMEYLPRGNLAGEADRGGDITTRECVLLLRQGLQALVHLHSHGYTHRDIKPANILVYSRTPFHVKLADFGLSQSSSALYTFCGTEGYLAPEVSKGRYQYTSVIDIWALGVVVFQFAHGLPNGRNFSEPRRRAKKIIDTANDVESDKLTDLLCSDMLVEDYRKRLSARDCLERALQIPVVPFRLQSSLYQDKSNESSILIRESPQKSQTKRSGSENTPIARESPKYDHPALSSKSSAAETLQHGMCRSVSVPAPTCSHPTVTKVVVSSDHIEVEVQGKTVSMRRSDAYFNARQLLSLITNGLEEQEEWLKRWRCIRGIKQDVLEGSDDTVLWIPFDFAKEVCCELNLKLKPLLDYGNGFIACHFGADVVMLRKAGFLINVTHVFKIAKQLRRLQLETKVVIRHGPLEYRGKYCNILEGLKWCRKLKLHELATSLKSVLEDHGWRIGNGKGGRLDHPVLGRDLD